MRPPHSRGSVDVGGSEADAMAASIYKEVVDANTADWSRVVGCVDSVTLTGERPRWLIIRRSMV